MTLFIRDSICSSNCMVTQTERPWEFRYQSGLEGKDLARVYSVIQNSVESRKGGDFFGNKKQPKLNVSETFLTFYSSNTLRGKEKWFLRPASPEPRAAPLDPIVACVKAGTAGTEGDIGHNTQNNTHQPFIFQNCSFGEFCVFSLGSLTSQNSTYSTWIVNSGSKQWHKQQCLPNPLSFHPCESTWM